MQLILVNTWYILKKCVCGFKNYFLVFEISERQYLYAWTNQVFFIFKVFQELQVILKNADKIPGYANYFRSTKIQVHLMMPSWIGVR